MFLSLLANMGLICDHTNISIKSPDIRRFIERHHVKAPKEN